jgi:Ca2+-binding EF-hand superfamily protein
MSRNKLILAALSSVLIVGAAAGASFAAPPRDGHHRPPHPHAMMGRPGMEAMREVAFVRMLKQFDTNKDGQVSKQEATDGMEKIFAAIDTNNDGSLTPGEIRKYHQTQMKDRKAPDQEMGANDDAAPPAPGTPDNGDQPPRDREGHGWMRHGGGMVRASMMMRRIDTDENGQISKQEAEAAFDKFFTRMDANKDGVISIDDMPDRPFL